MGESACGLDPRLPSRHEADIIDNLTKREADSGEKMCSLHHAPPPPNCPFPPIPSSRALPRSCMLLPRLCYRGREYHFLKPDVLALVISFPGLETYSGSQRFTTSNSNLSVQLSRLSSNAIFLSGYFISFLVRISHRGKASDWGRNLGVGDKSGMQGPRLHRGFLPTSCLELLLLSTMS